LTSPSSNPPAGFYDHNGRQRWWDGAQWTDHYQTAAAVPTAIAPAPQPVHVTGPATAASLNVKREVVYNRQQKGHSIVKHIFLGGFLLWIPTIYYAASPNHYFHA
jgi:hypothetical protein